MLEQEEVNTELDARRAELDEANAFLAAILETLHSGVIVLDHELAVQIWDTKSADTWGLRPEEVIGRAFTAVDCGLPVDELLPAILECLEARKQVEITVDAMNRLGRAVAVAVRCQPLGRAAGAPGVVLLIDVEEQQDNG